MTKQASLWLKGMYIVNTAWKYVKDDYGMRESGSDMENRRRIGEKQMKAEIRNKLRKAKQLERAGQVIPTVLFERVRELEARLIK